MRIAAAFAATMAAAMLVVQPVSAALAA